MSVMETIAQIPGVFPTTGISSNWGKAISNPSPGQTVVSQVCHLILEWLVAWSVQVKYTANGWTMKENTNIIEWFRFSYYDRVIPKKNNLHIKTNTLTGKSFIGPTREQKECAKMVAHESRHAVIYSVSGETLPMYVTAAYEEIIRRRMDNTFGRQQKTNLKELTGKLSCEISYSGRADLDNMSTTILDSLQLSGKIKNDRQIDELRISRIKIKPDESYRYLTKVIVSTFRRKQ